MSTIFNTDSYKVGHWKMLPENTTGLHSYLESRVGAKFDETVFFGLQAILQEYLSKPICLEDINEAEYLFSAHFGTDEYFNKAGWLSILHKYQGKLPLIIKAVPEGTPVPVNNVLMTVENTDKEFPWLVNYVESLITHVWYPTTVATLSRECKKLFLQYANDTCDGIGHVDYQLHDFGYRGVSSQESAGIGGLAHLVNFNGTDTIPAIKKIWDYRYGAYRENFGIVSVAATEHSIMTARGPNGEADVIQQLLNTFKKGILSVVADSYDIYNFVDNLVCKKFKKQILERDGVFVVRPDSITPVHDTPELLMLYILNALWCEFDGTHNSKGYKVLNPKVRVIWGDGIDIEGIRKILQVAKENGFASENMIFGMGGGLLQKVNRDTQRFAFKNSAQERESIWMDIFKKPLDLSKASKRGRLMLVRNDSGLLTTVQESDLNTNLLETVFLNGKIVKYHHFNDVRSRARILTSF